MGNRLLIVIFMLAWSMALFAAEPFDRIIVKVDNDIITLSDLEEVSAVSMEEIKSTYPPDQWDDKLKQLQDQILNQMINERVCVRVARDLEIQVTDQELDAHIQMLREKAGVSSDEDFNLQLAREGLTLDELRESIRRQSLARKVLQKEVYSKVDVPESLLESYYQEHRSIYAESASVRIGLLLLEVKDTDSAAWDRAEKTANEIYERIADGADFAEQVKQFSQGPAVDQGGDIGYLEKGKALPEIETIAFSMKIGDVSKPFRTDHGWNLIKILDLKNERIPPLSEKRDEIETILRQTRARDLEMEWFEKQRSRTYIEKLWP